MPGISPILGLRTEIVDITEKQGKDTVSISVRAASKMGAILTARLAAISVIPIREQKVMVVNNLSNDRVFDKWKVEVADVEQMGSLFT